MEDPVLGSPASLAWGGQKPVKESDRESESEAEGLRQEWGPGSLRKTGCQAGGSDRWC